MPDIYDPSATSLIGSLFAPLDYPRRALWRGVTGLAEGDPKAAAPLGMGALTGVLAALSRNPLIAAAALPLGLATGGASYGLGEALDPSTYYDPGEESGMLAKTLGDPMTYLALGGAGKGIQAGEKLAARLKSGTLAATEIPEGLGSVGRVPRDMLPFLKNAAQAEQVAPELGAAERAMGVKSGPSLDQLFGNSPVWQNANPLQKENLRRHIEDMVRNGEKMFDAPMDAKGAVEWIKSEAIDPAHYFDQYGQPGDLTELPQAAAPQIRAKPGPSLEQGGIAPRMSQRVRMRLQKARQELAPEIEALQQGQMPGGQDVAAAATPEDAGPQLFADRSPDRLRLLMAQADSPNAQGMSPVKAGPAASDVMDQLRQMASQARMGQQPSLQGPEVARLQELLGAQGRPTAGRLRFPGLPANASATPDLAPVGGFSETTPQPRLEEMLKAAMAAPEAPSGLDRALSAPLATERQPPLRLQQMLEQKLAGVPSEVAPAEQAAAVAPEVPRGPSPRDFGNVGEIPEPVQPPRKIVVRDIRNRSSFEGALFILREPNDPAQAVNAVLKVVSKFQPTPAQQAELLEAAKEGLVRLSVSPRDKNMALLKIKQALQGQ